MFCLTVSSYAQAAEQVTVAQNTVKPPGVEPSGVELLVLGVAQDAGYPQLNCYKPHCQAGWDDTNNKKICHFFGAY